MKLIIGNQNYSTWSMRPWLFIKHHNLDVEIEKLVLFASETVDKLSQYFSNGKVPLLTDGDLEIWDSLAILEYLAEKFPDCRGWPLEPSARAVARSVCAEMHSGFAALRNEMPMNCRAYFPNYTLSEAGLKDISRIQQIWNACRVTYGHGGPWLFGEFSIADAMYAPIAMRFRSVDVELDPVSQSYYDAIHQNSAVVQWLEEGALETEILTEDELDWPSEPIR